MLNSTECRARALSAVIASADVVDPETRLHWQAIAAWWTGLAVQAEAHEALQSDAG
jgi:hypothetical protein